MELDVLPLAEVDLKVGDVAIKFENDEIQQGTCDSSPSYDTGSYENFTETDALNFITKDVTDYEECDIHFLSNQCAGDPNDPNRKFQCEDCGRHFIRNEHLKNHRRTHTGERPYECNSCQRSFAKHFDLTRHKQYVHGSVTTFFICEECGRTFSRKDHLKSHLITHKNQPFKTNDDISSMLKTFTCQICGRTYCRLENLKKHMQKHFGGIESANSDSKDGSEDMKNDDMTVKDFNFHFMSTNDVGLPEDGGLRPFACDYCGRLFVRKDHLKNHERTHTGERPFQCDRCDKRFAKRFVMTRHLQNVHRINIKMHECSECERKFARRDHLKTHMKIHILAAVRNQQKDKLHKCEICDREFTRSDNLKTHMKIHLLAAVRKQQEENEQRDSFSDSDSDENYSCQTCGNKFSSLDKLQKHEKEHDEDGETS